MSVHVPNCKVFLLQGLKRSISGDVCDFNIETRKRGDFSTCDAPRPGRHKTVTTPEIIHQIHKLILKDRQISAKSKAEQLGISSERVGSITHEDLDTRKLSVKVGPEMPERGSKTSTVSVV